MNLFTFTLLTTTTTGVLGDIGEGSTLDVEEGLVAPPRGSLLAPSGSDLLDADPLSNGSQAPLLPPDDGVLTPITPQLLREMYGISGVDVEASSQNLQAIAGILQPVYDADMEAFFAALQPAADTKDLVRTGDTHPPWYIAPSTEFTMDLQYMMGVAPGVATEFHMGSSTTCLELKNMTDSYLERDDPPLVVSMSFGWMTMRDGVWGCTEDEVAEIERNFEELGRRGVSLIAASGDAGSGFFNSTGEDPELMTLWPANSPWVTAVGATVFSSQDNLSADNQEAMRLSSGGFHPSVAAPEWQKAFTEVYLAKERHSLPPETLFTATGRGVPDVSLIGQQSFRYHFDGDWIHGGYTSAAAPSFAGMVSLLNEARLQRGMPPLGFLNPFLYANADVFTDITVGKNDGRRTDSTDTGCYTDTDPNNPNCIESIPYGFLASEGWDPVTGLGTPVFSKLLEAALNWS